ncbi:hypothetical protein O0544_17265 [Edwardsiella anguillarum]|nr:hypothetical protein [Edwardsiella anguillarum]
MAREHPSRRMPAILPTAATSPSGGPVSSNVFRRRSWRSLRRRSTY